jgi:hypothetical protein
MKNFKIIDRNQKKFRLTQQGTTFLLISTTLFLSSCGPKWVKKTREMINIPELNTECSRELGETLLDKGFVTSGPAIEMPSDVNFRRINLKFTLGAGSYGAVRENDTYTFYYPSANTVTEKEIPSLLIGYRMRKSDGKLDGFYSLDGTYFASADPVDEIPEFEFGTVQALNKPSFRQQLIYNGMSDNNLKFLYREFSNHYARAPFSQEVQYDLEESSIIGFKGARIKVLDATNRQIRYKVLASFPDQ